jgi:arginase
LSWAAGNDILSASALASRVDRARLGEWNSPHESHIKVFTMRAIDELGMRSVMEKSIALASNGTAGFVVSLDADVVDPDEAPGVGAPVPGGITYREAHLAMEMVADSRKMLAFELVEINPIIDVMNKTAILGVGLVSSALGKKIL